MKEFTLINFGNMTVCITEPIMCIQIVDRRVYLALLLTILKTIYTKVAAYCYGR